MQWLFCLYFYSNMFFEHLYFILQYSWFTCSSAGKDSACNAGDLGSIRGSGRSPGEGKGYPLQYCWASLVAQLVQNLPEMQETWVRSLGWEDALEKGKAPHSSVVSMGSQGVTHDWAAFTSTADSQYCVIFRYIAEWFSYTECMNLNVYIYSFSNSFPI